MHEHEFGRGVSATVAAALSRRGIHSLFPIQRQVVPVASDGRDVLARSPTGSGKTIAFGIPLVQSIDRSRRGIQALVLVPTRELAVQVAEELGSLGAVKIETIFGGVKQAGQVRGIRTADVLVACPGRLEDLIQQGEVDLGGVRCLVLDEADRMLDMGFLPAVERILALLPRRRQTMLFSATLDARIQDVAARHTNDPVSVATDPVAARPASVDHAFVPAVHEEKLEVLLEVLREDRDLAVVFVRTKRGAARIARRLAARGLRTVAMHGDMVQNQRLRALRSFEEGHADVLVATDVFARGLDVDRISMVVNFDPPAEVDDYMHRAGRTGRAGRDGLAVTMVLADQAPDVQRIADALDLVEEFTANGLPYVQPQTRSTATPRRSGRSSRARAGGRSRRSVSRA